MKKKKKHLVAETELKNLMKKEKQAKTRTKNPRLITRKEVLFVSTE